MKTNLSSVEILRELCSKALEGKLTLEEFHGRWPQQAGTVPFVEQLFLDLEDAVEHIPGFWFSRQPNLKEFKKEWTYWTLYLDSELLRRSENPDELMRCREFVLWEFEHSSRDIAISEEEVSQRVSECIGNSRGR